MEAADPATAERRLALALGIRERILGELVPLSPHAPERAADARPLRIRPVEGGARWPEAVEGSADRERRVIRLADELRDAELTLSHELVHVLVGTDWSALPALLHEGLADHLGASVVGELPEIRGERGEALLGACGGLRVQLTWPLPGANLEPLLASATLAWRSGEASELGPAPSVAALLALGSEAFEPGGFDPAWSPWRYGVAFELVERLLARSGLGSLHRVCAEASAAGASRVEAARLLQLAGLPASTSEVSLETLGSWLADTWDEPTQRAWLERRASLLAPAVARAIGWSAGAAAGTRPRDPLAALRERQVRVSVAPAGRADHRAAQFELDELPTLLAAVAAQR